MCKLTSKFKTSVFHSRALMFVKLSVPFGILRRSLLYYRNELHYFVYINYPLHQKVDL